MVSQSHLLVSDGVETGRLDLVAVVVQTHVTQHHDGAEQQGSGIRQIHASNVGGGAMHLHDKHTKTHRKILDKVQLKISRVSLGLN